MAEVKKIALCLALLGLLACKRENRFDCFKANGEETTLTRNLQRFDSIDVLDNIDVNLLTGSEYKVEIATGKNISANINTNVKNGLLTISNGNTCNFVRGYKQKIRVTVYAPRLQKVYHTGVGTVYIEEGFKQDTVRLRVGNTGDTHISGHFKTIYTSTHGGGDIYLKGSTDELLVYTNGTNYIRAQNLVIKRFCYVSSYTLGDVILNLEGVELEYLINDDGNILYTGNPKSIKQLNNTVTKGKLIKG